MLVGRRVAGMRASLTAAEQRWLTNVTAQEQDAATLLTDSLLFVDDATVRASSARCMISSLRSRHAHMSLKTSLGVVRAGQVFSGYALLGTTTCSCPLLPTAWPQWQRER